MFCLTVFQSNCISKSCWLHLCLQGNEHLASKNPNAYLPFGAGGRMCISYRFALQEVRLGLIELLEKLHFEVQWNLMVPPRANTLGAAADDDSNCR